MTILNSLLTATRRAWNERLSVITVKGGSSRQRTTFYTALYHALLAPTLFQDMDGRYPGPDGKVHQNAIRRNYSTFSLWDTYRAAHPLYILLYPEDAADIVNSILDFARQNGRLPVWNMWASETDMMIGYHAASVISESVLKGLPEIDGHEALRLCRETAERDNYRGIGLYRRIGYVPVNVEDTTINNNEWSLSRTLEYAYDDACIARLARYVGEKKIARNYEHRAKNYRYVFDKETRFFRPRLIDGTFVSNFSPFVYDHAICESNAWHYLWNVPHDLKGLRRLMGKQHFAERLDSFFSVPTPREVELPIFSTGMIGQYAHGNEPSHHVAYLYNMIGRPERTTAYVHRILNDLYSDCPNGLAGNEDCGQMSAWAVFSAMGFYPVDPTSCRYETVAPIFPEIILHLHRPDGTRRDVVISRDGDGLRLNGRTLKGQSFSHSELLK